MYQHLKYLKDEILHLNGNIQFWHQLSTGMTKKLVRYMYFQRQVAKEPPHKPSLYPAHLLEASSQCDTCIWPISREFHLIQGDPIKNKYLSVHPKLLGFSDTASIKGITETLNHLSKEGKELKSTMGVEMASPWIIRFTSGSVQKSRCDKASPSWPPITSNKNSNHASQRDVIHPARSQP